MVLLKTIAYNKQIWSAAVHNSNILPSSDVQKCIYVTPNLYLLDQ